MDANANGRREEREHFFAGEIRAESSADSPTSSTSQTRLLRDSIASLPEGGSPHQQTTERVYEVKYRSGRAPSARHTPVGGGHRLDRGESRNYVRRAPSPIVGVGPSGRRPHSANSPLQFATRTSTSQEYVSNEVFLPASSSSRIGYRVSVTSIPDAHRMVSRSESRHSRTSSSGSVSFLSRTSSSVSEMHNIPLRESNLAEEALNAPRISGSQSRASGRQSIGQEWTRHHWDKIKDLEQESERARRCSKLSSGFAPLMVFGGLVFVCIGISASTNTGKDQARLKKLSAAPMAMGIFMLALGFFLIASWFGCRARARQLDRKLLHGSRRNSLEGGVGGVAVEENLVDAVLAKLYSQVGSIVTARGNRPETPTLPGVTLDGVIAHKEANTNASSSNDGGSAPGNAETAVLRETSL